jgi:hypothetical protein
MKPMALGIEKKNYVIVESELDGLLLWQEVGDLVGVIALGNAQAHPDIETHKALEQAEAILIALDTDEAGARASWQWWAKQYRQARRWPVINGKDPSEAFKNGLDIRTWTLAGLNIKDPVIRPFPKEWLNKFNYSTLERLAVMTVNAGMTDAQALTVLTVKPQANVGEPGASGPPALVPKEKGSWGNPWAKMQGVTINRILII